MIQRIQTLFLFLTVILTVTLFFCPIAAFDYGNINMNLTILCVTNQIDAIYFSDIYTLPLLILTVIMIILPVVTAFLYKKRYLQIKLCSLDVFLNAIFCGLVFLYYTSDIQKTISSESIKYSFGVFVPLINMVLVILAMRGIKKDIELLKSADRLR